MDLLGSEIFKLPGVAIRDYGPGERLGGDTTERLKKLYVYVRDGAMGLRVAAGRSLSALVDVFGPGQLLPPQLWETKPGLESRYATALVATTTLELPAAVFEGRVAAHPPLALAAWDACQPAASSTASRCWRCATPSVAWPIPSCCCSSGCPVRPARRRPPTSKSVKSSSLGSPA